MRRTAVYARYSSDLQRDRSIEDQVALCRDFAQRNGLAVVQVFEDRARSGSSVIGRDGIMRLMESARDHAFDVVIVEALDRLSRDQEDLAGIYKRLNFAGIEIQAVHDGKADQIQVGIRGLVGALYLQDLRHKVRRGMAGVVRDGRHAGGRAYGYRPVAGRPGELEIVESEADVVRGIFAAYVAGAKPRGIALSLNREGVPPPRGSVWTAITINGNRKRGHGLILNPIYNGKLVWNRVTMIKDPDTGRRVIRVNPREQWQVAEAPHLRIVDSVTFEAAQQIKQSKSNAPPHQARKPKRLLSGLLRCGACGGGMAVKDKTHAGRVRIACTRAREAGVCDNARPYWLDTVERAVVEGLKEKLENREALELYLRAYNAERAKLARDVNRTRTKIETRLATAERDYDRAYQGYIKGFIPEAEAEVSLPALRAARDRVREELRATEEAPKTLSLHPRAVDAYLAAVSRLDVALADLAANGDFGPAEAVRDLVETVTVHPPSTDGVMIEVRGYLSNLIGEKVFPAGTIRGGSMVAEEGLATTAAKLLKLARYSATFTDGVRLLPQSSPTASGALQFTSRSKERMNIWATPQESSAGGMRSRCLSCQAGERIPLQTPCPRALSRMHRRDFTRILTSLPAG